MTTGAVQRSSRWLFFDDRRRCSERAHPQHLRTPGTNKPDDFKKMLENFRVDPYRTY
jgi:hypothetical protein